MCPYEKLRNIAINAWVENGIGSYIVDDTVEWFVYPSLGATVSTSFSPYSAFVNVSEFGLYKVYFAANSNILTSPFARQLSEIEIDMRDDDGDGMADRWEDANGLDATVDDSALDKDGDGYSNLFEYQNATDPQDNTSFPISDTVVDISAGLVAHYEFEDNANDSSGNANDATEYNGVTYTDGVLGRAVSFDGVDDYIEVLFQNIYNESLTISFWAKTNDVTQCKENFGQTLIGHSLNGYVQNIQLCNDSLKTYAFTQNALDQNYTSNAKLKLNSWSNITYTIVKNGDINLYVDGVLQETFRAGNDVVSGDYITFGDLRASRGLNYKGLIDDVRIYNRILNDSEITELYKRVTLPSETYITHNGLTYGTVTSPYTGRVWLDRNLGASQVCTALDDTACYGDYYQWGRAADGHEKSTSSSTTTLATDISPTDSSFITNSSSPYDWTTADNDGILRASVWSKTDGSSVCPVGYRIPTEAEITSETLNASTSGMSLDVIYSDFLKIPSAGYRYAIDGSFVAQGSDVHIWIGEMSNLTLGKARALAIGSDNGLIGDYGLAGGFSVRCIKEATISQNTSPTVGDQNITVSQDSSSNTITLSGSDADGDTLSYIVVTQPAHGSLSATAPNLSYTPTAGYSGSDSFTYKVNDGTVDSATATVNITISATPTATNSIIKKTGQTLSYDVDGNEVTDNSLKDDGYYQTGVTPRYTRASDIVTDELTGLMWQDDTAVASITKQWLTQANYDTCVTDQTSPACYDTSGDTATTYCSDLSLGGYTDWRLPTLTELEGIVEYGKSYPAIDTTYFNNVSSGSYWSSTTYYEYKNYAWIVYFYYGYVYYGSKYNNYYVRCVRAGQ